MADTNQDVRRVEVTEANLSSTLKTKMIGLSSDTYKLGAKFGDGTDKVYSPDESNVTYGDVTINDELIYSADTSTKIKFEIGKTSIYSNGTESFYSDQGINYIPDAIELRIGDSTAGLSGRLFYDTSDEVVFRAGTTGNNSKMLLQTYDNGYIKINSDSGYVQVGGSDASQSVGFYGSTGATRASAISDPSGGSTVDTECRNAVDSILAALRAVNLIAT